MKELDIVKLNKDFNGVPAGTIVLEYDGTCFEVEYFDDDGDTIDVLTTPTTMLDLVAKYNI